MYRRNPSNSPTLAYVTGALPFVLVPLLYLAMNAVLQGGSLTNIFMCALVVLVVLWGLCAAVYVSDVLVPKFILFILVGGLAVSALMLLMTTYNYLSSYSFTATNIIKKILLILAVVLGLAIVTVLIPTGYRPAGMSQFLQEWAAYLREEWRVAPPSMVVLLALELLVLVAYFLVPWYLETQMSYHNGVRWLYRGQRMLSQPQETVVATARDLEVINPEFAGNPYLKTYTVSMWVYMNPRDAQMTEAVAATLGPTNLFYYGTSQLRAPAGPGPTKSNMWELVNPKPRVAYMYDYGSKKYAFVVGFTDAEPYRLYLELQKWHQLVLVVEDNGLSLFVDGVLDKAFPVPGTMPEYTADDVIVLGDIQGAVYGAIADVVYYDHALTPDQVSTSWNTQKYTIDTA